MTIRKNAILLFSKVPEAGKVKTRLTHLKDGSLPPEWASELYQCMLFDVVDCVCKAASLMEERGSADGIQDVYDIVISAPGEEQEAAMRRLFAENGPWPRPIIFINDTGASFDEHYNCSFNKTWDMGYDVIMSMGCDMPALTCDIILMGFARLHELCSVKGGGIVLSPDQEMGVSIVGWTRETAFDHSGVFYNRTGLTVLPAYIEKAERLGLPCYYLPAMPDIDTMGDLMHNITLVQALGYCSQFQDDVSRPSRTIDCLAEWGLVEVRVMPNNLMDDRSAIDL